MAATKMVVGLVGSQAWPAPTGGQMGFGQPSKPTDYRPPYSLQPERLNPSDRMYLRTNRANA
jgi:hypothetical protein